MCVDVVKGTCVGKGRSGGNLCVCVCGGNLGVWRETVVVVGSGTCVRVCGRIGGNLCVWRVVEETNYIDNIRKTTVIH